VPEFLLRTCSSLLWIPLLVEYSYPSHPRRTAAPLKGSIADLTNKMGIIVEAMAIATVMTVVLIVMVMIATS
jgi:hypothetical protein